MLQFISQPYHQRFFRRRPAYRVCLVHPVGGGHQGVFEEFAELITNSLQELGMHATWSYNCIEHGATNIIIGVHLLGLEWRDQLPSNTILINTEQLGAVRSEWRRQILDWFSFDFRKVDYAQANVMAFTNAGVPNVKLLKLGFQKELARLKPQPKPTVDILFYGTLCTRRESILADMKAAGLNVKHLYGVYGKERDHWLTNTRLVLNMHYFPTQIFESIRAFYPVINGIPVLSELNPSQFEDNELTRAVIGVPYDNLVQKAVMLCKSPDELLLHSKRALDIIRNTPQASFTAEAFDVQ